MVSLHRYKRNYRSFILLLFSLVISFKSFGVEINTGNLLDNSGFTGGTSNWVNHGTTQQHHVGTGNECFGSAVDNSNSGCGVSGSLATLDNGGVSQTIKLSEKTNMTQVEINNGFSSTMSADIWYWHGEDTVTMKQELTDSAGNTTTQTRIVTDSHNNYQTYTDKVIIGTNTSTDYDIKAQLDIDDSANCSSHCGPDIDNVTLNVNYTYIPPINEETQDVINNINTDIITIIEDLPEDFDWYEDELPIFEMPIEEEIVFEDDFTFGDSFYFEDIEIVNIEELPPIEEFGMESFEEMPNMEMVFFEEEFSEPMMISEEIFTEEFEEDFTSFIEETGMEEEFIEFLEEEGITAEEFFEEIIEEEFNDELTEESFEEFEEPMEEIATNEESVPEVIEEKEEAMEEPKSTESEPVTEEKEVANNESKEESSPKEEEPSSKNTEESEVQPEDNGEEDSVQPEGREEVDTEDRIATDVTKVETKLKQNLKKIAKQIAKVTKETTQNLSKEDLFFKENSLESYKQIAFYSAKDIYANTNIGLFLQIDLSSYSGDIYVGTSLSSYADNDPIEIHRVKLLNINKTKQRLMAELEALKQ